MKKFLIERDIPAIGTLAREQLREAAKKSNAVLAELAPAVQWIQSYVAKDKLFCVYLATEESLVYEHARRGGFPANRVFEIGKIIDPTTAV